MLSRRIKVLIIDDSALVRNILQRGLAADPNLEVVGTAPDVYVAREKIVSLKPDVLTLDVEMPRMDGIEFLRKLMPQYPIPVVMVSSLTERGKEVTLNALEAGAIDFVTKPKADLERGLDMMMSELRTKIKIASTANVAHWKSKRAENAEKRQIHSNLAETTDKIIAIGASTGGTEAIRKVVEQFPANMPGVAIVQHIPAGFTKSFADRLNQLCRMEVREAQTGDRLSTGTVLIAPGDFHMKVIRSGGQYHVICQKGPKVNGHCPAVDVLMESVAECAGANALGAILTGMGADGAKGLKAMRDKGAKTIAQDQATSVVYGMPKVAADIGAVDYVTPLDAIAEKLLSLLSQKKINPYILITTKFLSLS